MGADNDSPAVVPDDRADITYNRPIRPLYLVLGGLVIGLVLVGFVVEWYYCYRRPVGRGPAGPPLPNYALGQEWTRRECVLVGFGDDAVAGVGGDETGGFYFLLASTLRRALPNHLARCYAVPGALAAEVESLQLPQLEQQANSAFGVVILHIGTSDLFQEAPGGGGHRHANGAPPTTGSPAQPGLVVPEGSMHGLPMDAARPMVDAFDARLHRLLDGVEDRFPGGCIVYLGTVWDPTDDVGDIHNAGAHFTRWPDYPHVLSAVNGRVIAAATSRDHVELVDVWKLFKGHGIHCQQWWRDHYRREDPHFWYLPSLQAPNRRGHDAMLRLFAMVMAGTRDRYPPAAPPPELPLVPVPAVEPPRPEP